LQIDEEDTPETFTIEWTARFSIDDSTFIIQERSGRIVAIDGYPTAEISAACRDWAARSNRRQRLPSIEIDA
jgi:hypothetical protein